MGVGLTGNVAPALAGMEYTWDPRGGYQPGVTYRGEFTRALQTSSILAGQRIAHRFRQDGAIAEIVIGGGGVSQVDSTATEVPIDQWQFVGNELQKDLYEHPKSLAIEASKAGSLGAIRQDVANYNTGQPYGTFAYAPAQQSNVSALFARLIRGGTHYPIGQAVLKHTQTVSDGYNGNAVAFSNQECIFTPTQLLAECATFAYPIPPLMRTQVNSVKTPADAAGYLIGWRKLPIIFSSVANYKIEIQTEYWFNQWSLFEFDPAA